MSEGDKVETFWHGGLLSLYSNSVMYSLTHFQGTGWWGEAWSHGLWDHYIWYPTMFWYGVMSEVLYMGKLGRWPAGMKSSYHCSCRRATVWVQIRNHWGICHGMKGMYVEILWQKVFSFTFSLLWFLNVYKREIQASETPKWLSTLYVAACASLSADLQNCKLQ
jgi:hypothetical protein